MVGGRGPRSSPIPSHCDLGRSHFFPGSATPSVPGEGGSVKLQRPFLLQLFLMGHSTYGRSPYPLLLLAPAPPSRAHGCRQARGPAHLPDIISWPRPRPDPMCPCSPLGISAPAALLPGTLAWLASSHFPAQRPRSPSPSCPRRVKKPLRPPAPHHGTSQCIFVPGLSTAWNEGPDGPSLPVQWSSSRKDWAAHGCIPSTWSHTG